MRFGKSRSFHLFNLLQGDCNLRLRDGDYSFYETAVVVIDG